MMLIIVILALASIIGVGYFITTLVVYLKRTTTETDWEL